MSRVTDLGAPAPTVVRLIQLLNRDEVERAAIEETVQHDAVLSAKLLSLVNSASFGLAQPVESLHEVLLYVGDDEVYRLALAVGLSGVLGRKASAYAMDEGALWRHSLLSGKCASMVATTLSDLANPPTGPLDRSVAFTAGLLHDLGKVVLNQVLDPPAQRALADCLEKGEQPTFQVERKLLGADHAEVGACLLNRWRIPDDVVLAVASHHDWRAAEQSLLSSAVFLANDLAHAAASSGEVNSALKSIPEAAELGIRPEEMERLVGEAVKLLPQIEAWAGFRAG